MRLLTGSTIRDVDLRAAVEPFEGRPYAVVVDDVEQITVEPTSQAFDERPTLLHDLTRPAAYGRQALVLIGDAIPILTGRRRSLTRVLAEFVPDGVRMLLTPHHPTVAREHGYQLEPDQFFARPPGRGYLASGVDVTLVQWFAPDGPEGPVRPVAG